MSVRLKIEDSRKGLVATITQRDDMGKVIGRAAVFPVGSKGEAKQQAKTLARSLGLTVYEIVDKTDGSAFSRLPKRDPAGTVGSDTDCTKAKEAQPPWVVPGAGRSL